MIQYQLFTKPSKDDINKAIKKGIRDANLGDGFVSSIKVFKNKKKYNRRNKHSKDEN